MRGKISDSLLALHHLEYLDFSGNYLGGVGVPIPRFLGSLQSLSYLNLSVMNFDGDVPPQLGNLSRLLYLDLSLQDYFGNGNKLHAEDISWLPRLSLLKFLDMSNVNLATVGNWIQVVSMLSNLSTLRLRECQLALAHTPVVHTNLTSLQMLDLTSNRVDILNPSYWFWDVGTIKYLDLTNNEIARPFPDSMGNMTSLEVLNLGGNYLTNVNSRLLKNMCSLRVLALWSNQISQDTSANGIVGSLPIEIGMLGKLSKLYLDGNQLNGYISKEHFASLVNLKEFDISYNFLYMMINSNWIPPFKLQLTYFPRSKLGPQFPLWLKEQTDIINLDISDSGIVDHLPDWFWIVFSNVQYLNISCNQISGRLPRTLEFMSSSSRMIFDLNSNNLTRTLPQLPRSLVELDISRNSLSGPLPRNFGAPFLHDILLSENSINGTIPIYICQLQFLNVLDLAKNYLVGQFPVCSEVSELSTAISIIFMYGNNLSGNLSFLQSCPKLILLDLANNKFVGEIPTWIAKKVPMLSYLRLRHNMLSGSIPVQLTQLAHLQYLDLADNRISGSIPHTLGNMKAMTQNKRIVIGDYFWWSWDRPGNSKEYYPSKYDERLTVVTKGQNLVYTNNIIYVVGLDLSCNNLVGEIPTEITSLVELNNLNISSNQLSGKIPEKIGLLRSLESLDLSCNMLSGQIPSGLLDMTMLSKLNLSYNNLSGRVPSGNQLQALSDPAASYIGNNYLCGPPLPRKCSGPVVTGSDLDTHQAEAMYFYLGLAAGFVLGLWVILVIFLFCKRCRLAYFQLFDKLLHAMRTSAA